jgi:hypothetical protein
MTKANTVTTTPTSTEYYDERLHEMLRYKRPHGSKSEVQWIERFIMPYDPLNIDDMALVITVPHADGRQPKTLFSCHTDTVHRNEGKQRIKYDRTKQTYYKTDGEPLGADDAAGAWVMLEMIDAGVPGCYFFHRAEECGGLGSSHIFKKYGDILYKFNRAIAFDRRGSTDVITHQGWSRCCSDAFAQALADALNTNEANMYLPDDSGVFTDTANYTDIIPECTNLSCGYDHEHSGAETLHLPSLFNLRDACLAIEWDDLPTDRDPTVTEYKEDKWSTFYKSYDKQTASNDHTLYDMTKAEMYDMAYTDPETFVMLVRAELFGEPVESAYGGGYAYDDTIYNKL